MDLADLKESNIVWSGKDFKLSDFVKRFPPPQIIKVDEGYYDEFQEERTLGSSQLLTLHKISEFVIVIATDLENHDIAIPITSKARVEIVCNRRYYTSVEDLSSGSLSQFFACLEKHPWLDLDKDDVLEIKKTDGKNASRNHLLCFNLTKNQDVSLPLEYAARFKVLGQCPVLEPTMSDIVKYCRLPCVVQFVDDKMKVIRDGFNANFSIGMNQLGPLTLRSLTQHRVVFATTWEEVRVIPLPLDLEIRVVAAHGAITNEHGYDKLCKIAHKKISSEELVLTYYRHGKFKVILENQDQFPSRTEPIGECKYWDVGPAVPPRSRKPKSPLRVPRPITLSSSDRKTIDDQDGDDRTGLSRSMSVNIPVDYDDDDGHDGLKMDNVFGQGVGKKEQHQVAILSSLKNVYDDLKQSSFARALRKKITLPNVTLWRKRDTKGDGVTSSHATTSPVYSDSTIPTHRNSNSPIRPPDPAYNEVRSLPGNIAADRLNYLFCPLVHSPPGSATNSSQFKIRNPGDIRTWTINEVSECLRYCRLEDHIEAFRTEKIDGCLLSELDEESLRCLGVTDGFHIKKLLKIINGWLPKHEDYVPMNEG